MLLEPDWTSRPNWATFSWLREVSVWMLLP